jgi:hypothetical protein
MMFFAVLGRSCCCKEMASEEAYAERDKVQAELAQRASSFGVCIRTEKQTIMESVMGKRIQL